MNTGPATNSPSGVAPLPGGTASPGADLAIATVGNYSGVPGSVFGEAPKVLQAWARAINDQGGIRGHRVRVLAADDGADTARHQSLVKDLVERQGVIAFVGVFAPITGRASVDYLTAKRIPTIGGLVSDPWFSTNPMYFPQTGAYENFHFGPPAAVAQVAKAEGRRKVGLLACVEAQTCQEAVPFWEKFSPEVGMTVVYKANASIAQPDFTAECLAAQNRGAEILMIALDGNSVRRLAASCARQGYRPILTMPSQGIETSMLSDPAMDGLVGGLDTYPYFLDGVPGAAAFRQAVLRTIPSLDNGTVAMDVWVAAEVFHKAVLSGPGAATSPAILDGLWSINGDDIGGLTQPLRFQRDQPNPQRRCWYVAQIKAGRLTSPDAGHLSCADRS